MGSPGSLRLGGPGVGSLEFFRLGGPGVGSLGSLRLGGPGVGSLGSLRLGGPGVGSPLRCTQARRSSGRESSGPQVRKPIHKVHLRQH